MAGAALSYTTARGLLKQPYKQELAKTLAEKIKSLADDRRREGVMSELDALAKPTSIGSLAGGAASVINRDKEKE